MPGNQPESVARAFEPAGFTTSVANPVTTSVPPAAFPIHAMTQPVGWEKFRKKFGDDLVAQFSPEGRLLNMRGHAEHSAMASGEFRADDPQKALARARELLAEAASLIKLRPELPVESTSDHPIYQGDETSAHVYFHESSAGIPLAPFGSISVDIGSKGELTGLYSDYVPDLKITNERKIGSEEAQVRALAVSPELGTALTRGNGKSIVWVLRPEQPGGIPEGRHAFEFNVQGTQVIVDAGTGAVLFSKDRRVY